MHKRPYTVGTSKPKNTGSPAHTGLLSTFPATHGGLREGSRQAPRSTGKDGAELDARWKGGAACTSPGASTVLLGNRVFCRVSSLRLQEGGLQFPSALESLCAARLRSLAANAAIKACFALELMLGSVVEWPSGRSWSWGTGRERLLPHPFLFLQLSRGSPLCVSSGGGGLFLGIRAVREKLET